MAHGVRKVNEFIVRDGRALIMTQNVATGISQAQWDSIADGTLYINPADGNFRFKKRGNEPKVWSNFTPDNLFLTGSIGSNLIAAKSITEPKMADNSISTRTLIDRNITSIKIASQAILTEHFATNSLDGTVVKDATLHGNKLINNSTNGIKILDRSLAGSKLIANTISESELNTDCVTNVKIKNLAVSTSKLADLSVSTAKLADSSIVTNKISNLNVTYEKLGKKSVDWDTLRTSCVRTDAIQNLAVSTEKIADSAIKTIKILDENVTNIKIAKKTITGDRIANKTITVGLLDDPTQTVVNNAVVHKDGTARVYGHLQVDKDIKSTSNNKTYSITGFKVYNPVFADYAEGFVTSEPVETGDIVEIDKHTCVKKADAFSRKIVGVVSDRFAVCLDADEEELISGAKTAIGLLGKVPVNIVGPVEAGDFIISAGDGLGRATRKYIPGAIVGKALKSKTTYGIGKVLCLINPM